MLYTHSHHYYAPRAKRQRTNFNQVYLTSFILIKVFLFYSIFFLSIYRPFMPGYKNLIRVCHLILCSGHSTWDDDHEFFESNKLVIVFKNSIMKDTVYHVSLFPWTSTRFKVYITSQLIPVQGKQQNLSTGRTEIAEMLII